MTLYEQAQAWTIKRNIEAEAKRLKRLALDNLTDHALLTRIEASMFLEKQAPEELIANPLITIVPVTQANPLTTPPDPVKS